MMDELVGSSPSAEGVASTVSDLHDAPLSALIDGRAPEAESAIGRVLELEGNGLLTVASFNASI